MTRPFAVVDLFSGPGGLGEGFSACLGPDGSRFYRCLLSVEKNLWAYRTLRLRAFYWEFDGHPPTSYYAFLNGQSEEPEWERLHPNEWRAARQVATHLEVGRPYSWKKLSRRIEEIRQEYSDRTVLLGGPPCQAYSLVGRARTSHISQKERDKDPRLSLHKRYANALRLLRPAAFVMENVPGILSATHRGRRVFPGILRELRTSTPTGYRLFALAPRAYSLDGSFSDADFLVRAEEHGVPQARRRVFVVGIRADLAALLPGRNRPRLTRRDHAPSTSDVIGDMPRLRSGLSREDSPASWRRALEDACALAKQCASELPSPASHRLVKELSAVMANSRRSAALGRTASGGTELPTSCPTDLGNWLVDSKIEHLPNNQTRGHMPTDLARYLFCTAFARAIGRSPKADDFPMALAPRHRNWTSGKFADRFRVQLAGRPSTTVTSHISKDGHYFIHPDPSQCRSLTVREAARLQTFPDNYLFLGNRTEQYVQVGNAVPPFLAEQIAAALIPALQRLASSASPAH